MRIASLLKPVLASAAAVALIAGFGSSSAMATIYDVTVWTGAPNGVNSSTIADAADTPTGTAVAHFLYSGPIAWVNNQGQNQNNSGNLAKDFLNIADISAFTSPTFADATAFGNSSLSVAGDAYTSFFQITGVSAGPVSGTITHDDGASVYAGLVAVYSSPAETQVLTGNFVLPAGAFTIDYVEANGSPSILTFTTSGVPELSTWAMMIIGFGGVGLQMRRRERNVAMTA